MTSKPNDLPAIPIGIDDIVQAAQRLEPWAHRTPVLTSRTLDERSATGVFLKCENFQRVGAFKFRGAMNALLLLGGDQERLAGVVTHSSGNHAQALALAGQLLGMPVMMVMPRTAPAIKRAATEGYGARVVPCEPTLASREATVAEQVSATRPDLVHPYDDWSVIAGQGTAALELLEQAGPLEPGRSPVGGGGLLAGTALAVSGTLAGNRSSASSRRSRRRPAFARDRHDPALERPQDDRRRLADLARRSAPSPSSAEMSTRSSPPPRPRSSTRLRFVWERFKIVIEPSSAVVVAPLLAARLRAKGRVGVILSGGNVDVETFFQGLAAQWL